jgi:hypothetical protein
VIASAFMYYFTKVKLLKNVSYLLPNNVINHPATCFIKKFIFVDTCDTSVDTVLNDDVMSLRTRLLIGSKRHHPAVECMRIEAKT